MFFLALALPVDKATRRGSINFSKILQVCDEYIENDISRKRQNIISLFLRANYKQRGKCIFCICLVRTTCESLA